MLKKIAENRLQINKDFDTAEKRQFFSPALLSFYDMTHQAIVEHARGLLLDVGCGDQPYKGLIKQRVDRYDTFDVEQRGDEELTYLGDAQDMSMIEDDLYDSAVCFYVLEHVPRPDRALSEINRVLKSGGVLVLAVPHLSRLHEMPHDYYRYTTYGLEFLLTKAGFEVMEIKAGGGLFSFWGHQFSMIFVGLFWHLPVIKDVVFFLNKWLSAKLCAGLDKLVDKNGLFALNYLCIAQKPTDEPPSEMKKK